MIFQSMSHHAVVLALLSAALFGVSTPAAKALLGSIEPTVLAGLLYCGAGVGVAFLRRIARTWITQASAAETPLSSTDMPWLAGGIVAGGIIGPLLLMADLERTDAATAWLLLTLEGVATALLAWFVFRENFDQRIAIGMACLVAGAVVLSWSGSPTMSGLIGPLAIAGACVAWSLDNNLTRKVSHSGFGSAAIFRPSRPSWLRDWWDSSGMVSAWSYSSLHSGIWARRAQEPISRRPRF